MAGSSPVEVRLRAVIEESRLSGLPLPEQDTWVRRFPGHADVVGAIFAEMAPAPRADSPEVASAVESSLPVWAEPPEALSVVREDAHGRLCESTDGSAVYILPKERLGGRNPATDYLARARRLATAAVSGIQAPKITSLDDGGVSVRFDRVPERTVSLRVGASQRRGATRRALEIMGRVAARIRHLHERGGAHGRLDRVSLRLDMDTRRLVVGTGLEDGPGLDGGTLEQQQRDDVRALGALLYGALAFEGTEPNAREIVTRHDAHELPSLAVRRPDLSRALVRIVERALQGGRPGGYESARDLLHAFDRICDHESDVAPTVVERSWRPRIVTMAASFVLAAVLAACHLLGTGSEDADAHLALRSGTSERMQRIRDLLDDGRRDEALRAWRDLERELGLTATPAATASTSRESSPSSGG